MSASVRRCPETFDWVTDAPPCGHQVTCTLPAGHKGDHQAEILPGRLFGWVQKANA